MGIANLRIFSGTGKKHSEIFIFVENFTELRNFDLIIAGGGAAGIMAAGIAAQAGFSVLVCEKMEKPQRKVRITGKGRCNLTNMRPPEEFLQKVRSSSDFFAPALARFGNRETVSFFERIGVPLTIERGERVFPASGRAWDIADAHVRWSREQGAQIVCHTRVTEVHTAGGRVSGVTLSTARNDSERVTASCVLLATGGASYPATGSTGDGYLLAHRLGHAIVEIRPSLTPLETSLPFAESLKGLRLKNISARLAIDDRYVQQEFGELEFTPFVSGPVTLRMSRQAVDALIDGQRVAVDLDLKPALNPTQLRERIAREAETLGPQAPLSSLLRKLLPAQLIRPFAAGLQIPERLPLNTIKAPELHKIVGQLKLFRLPISDYRPFEEAIVTAGGVSTAEVDPQTMQSRLVKGLYFAGELLDIDADTGGYNLQIAYSTGHLAGQMLGNK